MRVTQMNAFNTKRQKTGEVAPVPVRAELQNPPSNGINFKKLLSEFATDDYILAGLIIVLIMEGCDDYILLAALGYLFIMGLG